MRNIFLILTILTIGALTNASAGQGIQKFSIKKALKDTRANANLDHRIRLSFGKRGAGREWTAIRRTMRFGRSAEEACNRAFLSAVIALQDRAKKQGKRSVVGIYSYHKKRVYSSSSKFMCEDGNMMSAVTLRGKVR